MFCIIYSKQGPHLEMKLLRNGDAMRPHGLILCEDKATAYMDLLETFSVQFGSMPAQNITKNMNIQHPNYTQGAARLVNPPFLGISINYRKNTKILQNPVFGTPRIKYTKNTK